MFDLNNELEQALLLSMTDTKHLPTFYNALLNAKVHIYATLGQDKDEDQGLVRFGQDILIQHWEDDDNQLVIPFFSSPSMLLHSQGGEENAMEVSCESLFSIAEGASMLLNPGTAFERFFSSEEIQSMLFSFRGQLPESQSEEFQVEREFELTPLKVYPEDLVSQLTQKFQQEEQLLRAWMVTYSMEKVAEGEPQRLMIGLECVEAEPTQQLIHDVGLLAASSLDQTLYSHVDFIVVLAGENEISDYLINEVEPFYTQ